MKKREYIAELIRNKETIDITSVDAESTDEAFEIASGLFYNEFGHYKSKDDLIRIGKA